MDFELSDEQRQLADSLERLLAQQYGLDQRKAIIAAGGSAAIWAKIAELGILSLPVSETGGGFGGGAVDLLRPMALLGHALVIEPVIPHLTAARLLDRAAAALPAAAASSWHERLQQSVHGNLRLAWARSTGAAAPACSAQADGDGWRDLAVGAPGENRQQGAIFIYNGGAAALSAGQVIDPRVDGVLPGDKFAWSLAAGDIDADGDADLAVGAPRSILAGNIRSGKVIWYRATVGVLSAVSPLTQTHFAVGNTDDDFGRAVAVGDLGNDGRAEIAVGSPTETVGLSRVGAAYVFRGVGADPSAWRRIVQAAP